jgi:hypothetical protein
MINNRVGCRQSKMAIEGHNHGRGEFNSQKSKSKMDKELSEIRA